MTFNIFGQEIHIKNWAIGVLAVLACIIVGAAGFLVSRSNKGMIFEIQEQTTISVPVSAADPPVTSQQETTGEKDGTAEPQAEEIKVYVVGCVKKRGIVTLKKGQLIDDAIKAAGGATEEADLDNINLVYKLDDNVMLYIRSKKEGQAQQPSVVNKASNGTQAAGKGVAVIKDSGGAVVNSTSQDTKQAGRININTASVDELDTLPYIGKETAKDIIAFREKNGPFKKIEDIMKVPGIKDSRFSKIKDLITVK